MLPRAEVTREPGNQSIPEEPDPEEGPYSAGIVFHFGFVGAGFRQ
jgi:hypothetical protein